MGPFFFPQRNMVIKTNIEVLELIPEYCKQILMYELKLGKFQMEIRGINSEKC